MINYRLKTLTKLTLLSTSYLLNGVVVKIATAYATTNSAAFYSKRSISSTCLANQKQDRDDELQMLFGGDYPKISIAIEAVRKACRVTKHLQERITDIATLTKDDSSPVTVADFSSQAIILQHLYRHLQTGDTAIFLAEEKSDNLTPLITDQILQAVQEEIHDEETLKECIDLGQTFFDSNDPPLTYWCLDPIDGTKGFIRKEQYCVALGLIEHGEPTIGLLACPNLPFDENKKEDTGCIFVACKGQGCYQIDLNGIYEPKRIGLGWNPMDPLPASKGRFCVPVEQTFGDPTGKAKAMAKYMHGNLINDEIIHSIRMDSQSKYGVVARGDAEFYVRLPRRDHREWIWDVAPGVLILQEAGGVVTDANGIPLDFSCGAKLKSNYGVLGASEKELHSTLLKAYNHK